MNKIIVLQGCPCSGKTTWAKEYLANDENLTAYVNRDSIRMELNNGKYSMDKENEVTVIEERMVKTAILSGQDAIIDATNLNPKTIKKWENLAKELECDIEFKMFYITYEEAMKRSKKRRDEGGLFISKKVMLNFYQKYFLERLKDELTDKRVIREPEMRLPSIVICDLDATLALHQGREPFEWDLVKTDKIDPRLRLVLNNYMALHKVVFITGRPESARLATTEWLQDPANKLHDNWVLYMRNNNDFSHGDDYKEKVYREKIEGKYNVLCVFEDSNKCVTRWRELGLLTCQVANNDY
jgi:predicted kinase